MFDNSTAVQKLEELKEICFSIVFRHPLLAARAEPINTGAKGFASALIVFT